MMEVSRVLFLDILLMGRLERLGLSEDSELLNYHFETRVDRFTGALQEWLSSYDAFSKLALTPLSAVRDVIDPREAWGVYKQKYTTALDKFKKCCDFLLSLWSALPKSVAIETDFNRHLLPILK